jgi:hypothetical protein
MTGIKKKLFVYDTYGDKATPLVLELSTDLLGSKSLILSCISSYAKLFKFIALLT